jgi:hypothetical protein
MGASLMVEKSDRDKGIHILEAFRYYSLAPGHPMTVDMRTSYFERNSLNLEDMESGLNYTRLQGWTENKGNPSTLLTEEGRAYLLD